MCSQRTKRPESSTSAKRAATDGTNQNSAMPPVAISPGSNPNRMWCGACSSPTPTSSPASASVAALTPLVSRNRTALRSMKRRSDPPLAFATHAPTAIPPAPPTGSTAPKAISDSATRIASSCGTR